MQNDDKATRRLEERIAVLEDRLAKLADKQQRDVKALLAAMIFKTNTEGL